MSESVVLKIICEYQNKYVFLALNDKSWEKIKKQISVLLENHTLAVSSDIRDYLNKIINNYIDKQIIKKNPRIMNNLLFLLSKEYSNYSVLFRKFLEKIEEYHIQITEEYYQVLKEQDRFRKILIYLDCEDLKFEKLKDYLKKLVYYEKIKVNQKSFRVCKNIFESYFSLLDDESKNYIFKHFDFYVEKFKYLITQEDILEDIFDYCQNKYAKYSIGDFRMILFAWDIEKIDALIKEYRRNQYLDLENLKKYDYLLLLVQDVHRLNASSKNMKIYTFNEDIKEVKDSSNNLKRVNAGRLKRKTLHEYIGSDSQNLTDEDKKIIDTLYLKLSEERRVNIQNYLNGLFSSTCELGKKAIIDISIIRRQFRKYQETGTLERKGKKKNIYEYFVVDGKTLSEEDKKIIDTLYLKLSEERRVNIQNYLNGLFSSTCELGRKARSDIYILRQQFRRYQEARTLERKGKKKNIYEYFMVYGKTLSEEDKKIIDTLFLKLSEERRVNIQNYLNGLFSTRSELGRKAKSDIRLLRQQFRRYQETGTLERRGKKKCIYEYFEVNGKALSEEDMNIIDTLFSRLSEERRVNIQNYLDSLVSSTCKLGRKAISDISLIQRQFKRYQEIGTLYFRNVSNLLSDEEQMFQEQFRSFRKVHLQKYRVLLDALKIVEEYFYRLGYSSLEYQTYKEAKEQELISRGILSDLDFLSTFITESVIYIDEKMGRRTL